MSAVAPSQVSVMAMPTTIWSRPRRTQKSTMKSDDAGAGEHAGAEAVPLVAAVVGGDEAGVRAHQHHPLEADVEHAAALGHELAERRRRAAARRRGSPPTRSAVRPASEKAPLASSDRLIRRRASACER